jgi:hypothetical protein
MGKNFRILRQIVANAEFQDKGAVIIAKPVDREVGIGREEDEGISIAPLFAFVSRHHGKLTYTKSFLSGTIWYEDTSSYGTLYLPPGVTDVTKAILIKKKKVEIKDGGRLLLLEPGQKKSGLSFQVAVA